MKRIRRKLLPLGVEAIALFVCLAVVLGPSHGQSNREAEGARLLQGAIDMHFHMDPPFADGSHDEAVIETIRVARS